MRAPGRLIREARRRAGLRQRDLGELAGMPQSAVSAYESGRVQPSLPVLRRLVEAAGLELEISLRQVTPPAGAVFTGPVGRRLQEHRDDVREALRQAGYARPEIFGSVARGEDGPDSDVDVLVDVPVGTGLVGLAGMTRAASGVVGAPVDLLPRGGLRPEVAATIASDLVTV
ncbi:XRE family transcriptional regulator [Pseudokineococcus sp. 1T1Z-3]|uniref:XRE family transcriptional regulator n=1 Tax=Pseudokineococcus sp. 1T1Z-3 TaxID=3132745 RepID=UPI0030A0F435